MRAKPLVLVVLLAVLAGVAWVRPGREPAPFSRAELRALLTRPLDPQPGSDGARPPFLEALLAHPSVTHGAGGTVLRLGRVLADPTASRHAALAAGELLALEAEGPDGKLGTPLWRAVLDGPALTRTPEARTLKLYGCRHSATPEAGPALEDTYYARRALAQALRTHAAGERDQPPLVLAGEDAPQRGGVNFELQLIGTTQSLVVTFDGTTQAPLRVAREFQAPPGDDARVRAELVALVRELAAEAGHADLVLEGAEAPVADGVDVRLELLGERLALSASGAGTRLSAHLVRGGSAAQR